MMAHIDTTVVSRSVLADLWAKTPDPSQPGQRHLPLLTHLEDACEAATHYWESWLAPIAKKRIIAAVGGDAAVARKLVRLAAAAHDLGKAAPSFQAQVPSERDRIHGSHPALEFSSLGDANRIVPHALGGAALAQAQLERRGWSTETARSYVSVIAGHHGRYPSLPKLDGVDAETVFTGAAFASWSAVHDLVFERCLELAGLDDFDLETLSRHPLPVTVQVDLQALVVLADWCASDTGDFPLSDPALVDRPQMRDSRTSAERASAAWRRRAIPAPWTPRRRAVEPISFYRTRFGWDESRAPRRTQVRALEIARETAEPGLMIVEAPMGSGKTEIALAVAETLAERVGAGGVFFGLPTMATSDAMLRRTLDWLDGDPDARRVSVHLAHSKSAFNRDYTRLSHTNGTASIFDDADAASGESERAMARRRRVSAAVIADALSGRRTGVFANVVVGTIDQLLMVGLNAKHFALRHLAMSGKVVIIDEVHSADHYMRRFLVRALEWLGAYGSPVVLLSATLPPAQREELAEVYLAGVRRRSSMLVGASASASAPQPRAATAAPAEATSDRMGPAPRHRGRRPGWSTKAQTTTAAAATDSDPAGTAPDAYPLLTWTDGQQVRHEDPAEDETPATFVGFVRLDDDLDGLVDALRERTSDGGCVLIVRNTVQRAIELYERLLNEPGLNEDLVLAHSRFLAPDRSDNDECLRDRFGPPSEDRERPGRTSPAIVVSTQVAEQSLDVDFDLLVTDLAPADLVLQRIGRLHRHLREDRPSPLANPVCVLTGVESWDAEVPRAVSGSVRVYGEHALLRSALAFARYGGTTWERLELPADIPRVVREAYAEEPVDVPSSDAWQEALRAAAEKQAAEETKAKDRADVWRLRHPGGVLSLYGSSDANLSADGDERARAAVRDGEDTFEIILMQRGDDEATLRTLDTLGDGAGIPVPIDLQVPEGRGALVAAASTLRLPGWMCVSENGTRVIADLERQRVPSWQEHRLLRGQLVLVLDDDLEADLAGHRVRYSRERGL